MVYQRINNSVLKSGTNAKPTKQVLIKVTEEEKETLETIKQIVKEITNRPLTYKNLLFDGMNNFKQDPFINLRIEEKIKYDHIKNLEEQQKEYNNYFDKEIKKTKKELEEIKEKINGTIKVNMEQIDNVKNKQTIRENKQKEELNQIKTNVINHIKEVIGQKGYTEFNKDVGNLIKLTLNQPNFKNYSIPLTEVVETIKKDLFNNTEENKKIAMKSEVTPDKKNNEINLSVEEETAFNKSREFILNRYNKHKQNNKELTLKEFWNNQNSTSLKPKEKLLYVIEQKFLIKLDNEKQKKIRRHIINLIKNDNLI